MHGDIANIAMQFFILPASDAGEKKKEKICLVEYSGLEPLTSTLPVLRSSQMS